MIPAGLVGRAWAFVTGNLSTIAIGMGLLAACFLLGRCDGRRIERNRANAERAAANVIAVTTARTADEAAAAARVDAALTIAKAKEDLTDAIVATPDTAPDAVRVRLGCERLRRAGTADANLPSVCGRPHADGAQAGTAR